RRPAGQGKGKEPVVSLDLIRGAIGKSRREMRSVEVKNDPPPIFVSKKPAILVLFDGAPIWSPVQGTSLKFAVNTNWDVFQDGGGTFYLRNGTSWIKTKAPKGAWAPAGGLPADFSKLPDDPYWTEVRANLPGANQRPRGHPRARGRAGGLIQRAARGIDRDPGRAAPQAGAEHAALEGGQHGERPLLRKGGRQLLLSDLGPLVPRRQPERPLELCEQR